MTQAQAQYRDDVLTLKGEFSIAIATNPDKIAWVLIDGQKLPVWWKHANGDLEHELTPATPISEISEALETGDWTIIPISQDSRQHRERMQFTYGAQPTITDYKETETLEFIEKPDPDLVLPVFRLYDITTNTIHEYPDETGEPYIAVSHVWNQSTDEELRQACVRAHRATGQKKFWLDRWCIKQESHEDKAFHVPRIRDYYTHAQSVLVVAPDFVVNEQTVPEDFVEGLRRTRWFSRVWTFQEAMSSKRLMLDTGVHWHHGIVEGKIRRCHGERLTQKREVEGWKLNDDLWIDSQGRLTMAISDLLYSTGGRLWNLIVEDEKAKVSLTRLIHQTQYRRCRLEEDRFYGVMGMAHATASVKVQYGIGFTQALLKAAASGALDSKILASNSVNPLDGACWLPLTSTLGKEETLMQLSSQGRQTLTVGKKGVIVWCLRKQGPAGPGQDVRAEEWVVDDSSNDQIVLSLIDNGHGLYHRLGSRVETQPLTEGDPIALEIGYA